MDESPRRMPGTASPNSGNPSKLMLAATLLVCTAGFIALRLVGSAPDDPVTQTFASACQVEGGPVTAGQIDCTPADEPAPDTATGSLAFLDKLIEREKKKIYLVDQDVTAGDPTVEETKTAEETSEYPRFARLGYTVAELCAYGTDHKGLQCQTGSYNGGFAAAMPAADEDAAEGHAISGHVLTAEGSGLGGVKILATPARLKDVRAEASGKLRFWTRTNSWGAYSLEGLPEGEYTLRSAAQGSYPAARISARTGVDYADLVVTRNETKLAEGQVLDETGVPLEGVTVLPLLPGQPSVLTGQDGRFRSLVNVKSTVRTFALRFQRPGYHEQTGTVNFRPHDPSGAAEITIVMQPVESWTSVAGTVHSDSGAALAGRVVELRPERSRQSYRTTTDGEGRYTFAAVEAPADYALIVFGGHGYKDHQQKVVVTAEMDELEIVAESYEFGSLSGQLVNLNGEPVPDFDLVLRNRASREPSALVSTDADGNFELPEVPAGELVVASQSTPTMLVQGLQLDAGDELHLPLVLDWGEHQIRGLVVDAGGNPLPASEVVLRWSHESGGIRTRATRRTAADAQGQFAFSNLGPGPHSLQVQAPGHRPVAIDHDLTRMGYDLTVRLN